MKKLSITALAIVLCISMLLMPSCVEKEDDNVSVETTESKNEITTKNEEENNGNDDDISDDNANNGNTDDDITGDDNTGDDNTGDDNTGDDNTGDDNTGDDNTGDDNTGDDNTGDDNTGDDNTGDDNTGDDNTGDDSTGDDTTIGDKTDDELKAECEEKIAALEKYNEDNEKAIKDLIDECNAKIAELNAANKEHLKAIKALTEAYEANLKDNATYEAEFADISAKIIANTTKISTFETDLAAKIAELKSEANTMIDELKALLAKFENTDTEIEAKIAQLETKTNDIFSMHEHNYENWKTVLKTCKKGLEQRICADCDVVDFRAVSGMHIFKFEYNYNETQHWIECRKCGVKTSPGDHTAGEGRVCTVCGAKLKIYMDLSGNVSLNSMGMPIMNIPAFTGTGGVVYQHAQGGCIMGDYLITCMHSPSSNKVALVKSDFKTGQIITIKDNMPLGHGNDAAYNPDDNVIVVADCGTNGKNILHIVDANTLELKKSIQVPGCGTTICSIAYDNINKRYIGIGVQNDYIHMYDRNFNLIKEHKGYGMSKGDPYSGDFSMQGILTDGTYLYILEWHGGSKWAAQNVTIEAQVRANILVTDLSTGAHVATIPTGIKRELEFAGYREGRLYIACNNISWTGMEFYRVDVISDADEEEKEKDPAILSDWGSGTAADPYILTQKNFADYYENFNYDYYNAHVKLGEDIVINVGNNADWYAGRNLPAEGVFGLWRGPIGGTEVALTGGFDGNGHTISGVCFIGSDGNGEPTGRFRRVALFAGVAYGGYIKNLKLVNSYFESNATVQNNYNETAGLVARFGAANDADSNNMIDNCYVDAIIKAGHTGATYNGAGGIAGAAYGKGTISNCVFEGAIYASGYNTADQILGKVVQENGVTITNCTKNGSVTKS